MMSVIFNTILYCIVLYQSFKLFKLTKKSIKMAKIRKIRKLNADERIRSERLKESVSVQKVIDKFLKQIKNQNK